MAIIRMALAAACKVPLPYVSLKINNTNGLQVGVYRVICTIDLERAALFGNIRTSILLLWHT
jgi:hypothetical protein